VTLGTEYEFVLPRGYVDHRGTLHKNGTMRLATARDELAPLRDPTISGPDDPRITILVLTRVVTRLGTLEMITSNDIEGLFAADLAFLQDFYGVINFGSQEEYEALLEAQRQTPDMPKPVSPTAARAVASPAEPAPADAAGSEPVEPRPAVTSTVERIGSRRNAIEEVPTNGR
jgi:hypothetical protein